MGLADETFYQKHGPGLRRLAFALVGPSDADDVFSSAIVRVLGSKRWPKLEQSEQLPYATRIVTNEAKRWGSQAGRRGRVESLIAAQRFVPPELQQPDEIWSVVAGLSIRQRAVVFLTYYEDLDTAQVAKRLDISVGSVYQYLNRARTTLRKRIDA